MRVSDDFLVDIFNSVALPQVLDESDPSERGKLQDGRSDQYRDPSSVLANQLLFKGRATPKPQFFFVCQLILRKKLRRSQIGSV
jgi:hypothetical protein